eukprot:216409-Pyramimonas_sp.AAC.1
MGVPLSPSKGVVQVGQRQAREEVGAQLAAGQAQLVPHLLTHEVVLDAVFARRARAPGVARALSWTTCIMWLVVQAP